MVQRGPGSVGVSVATVTVLRFPGAQMFYYSGTTVWNTVKTLPNGTKLDPSATLPTHSGYGPYFSATGALVGGSPSQTWAASAVTLHGRALDDPRSSLRYTHYSEVLGSRWTTRHTLG